MHFPVLCVSVSDFVDLDHRQSQSLKITSRVSCVYIKEPDSVCSEPYVGDLISARAGQERKDLRSVQAT